MSKITNDGLIRYPAGESVALLVVRVGPTINQRSEGRGFEAY